jgi:hypothetical protein
MERLAPPAASMAGLQDRYGGLHRLGALYQLGQEELALGEEVADLLDALHETLVQDVSRRDTGIQALLGQCGGIFCLSIDDGLRHFGQQLVRHGYPPSSKLVFPDADRD